MADVIIVDDSSTVRSEVTIFLESEGVSVISAVDGLDGLEKINQNPNLKLIICDVNMPKMDGITMTEKLKEAGNDIPVIMLATESGDSLKQRGKEAGVCGWIVKPFNGPASIAGIKRLVN